jgi:hypothetical protein
MIVAAVKCEQLQVKTVYSAANVKKLGKAALVLVTLATIGA